MDMTCDAFLPILVWLMPLDAPCAERSLAWSRQVSWAGENREVLSLAFGFTVLAQRKLPVPVAALSKDRLCVTFEVSHLRQCVDGGLPLEHASLQD